MTADIVFASTGLALCLFALAVLARRDFAWNARRRSQALAEVVAYQCATDEGTAVYTPVYRFAAEGAEHEVADQVFTARPRAALGDKVWLTYPDGRPDLARVPRTAMWVAIYLALGAMAAVLAAKLLGWIG